MRAEDVVELYSLLRERGVQVWVDGGWGIDALLNEQTRPHKDFDALVQFDNLAPMTELLSGHGFSLKEIWGENRWVLHSVQVPLIGRESPAGREIATAFVLRDENGRELDFHVLRFDARGYGTPAWNSDFLFPPEAFQGRGSIAGTPVRCLSARIQMLTHTGYELQDKDLQDLRHLHERFGIEYPAEHAHLLKTLREYPSEGLLHH
jgi:lincosamide nucleotidyltransferase A/C/D/E